MELKIAIFECGDCHLIFGADDIEYEIQCCPSCQDTNITGVGTGTITGISEH